MCSITRNGIERHWQYSDNVCDPTQGFSYTPQTLSNFGKINLKRGKRVIEFVLRCYFDPRGERPFPRGGELRLPSSLRFWGIHLVDRMVA